MPKTALLVIDVQSAIVESAYRRDAVLAAIAAMAERARAAGAAVIYLQHCHHSYPALVKGAEGWAIHPAVAPKAGDVVVEKRASDGFDDTVLAEELARLGVQRLVICGLQTEFCVDATARAAFSRGFEVVLASDAHTTGDAVTPAETTIRHHNYALGGLAHPERKIAVVESAAVGF
ncbi:MAG: isochorismatase family protein [Caulobacterales bacterium]